MCFRAHPCFDARLQFGVGNLHINRVTRRFTIQPEWERDDANTVNRRKKTANNNAERPEIT